GRPAIEAKLELLRTERGRASEELARLGREVALAETRLELKRRLAREADAARRDAGTDLSLLEREVDALKQSVRGLEQEPARLLFQRTALTQALGRVDAGIAVGQARLRGSALPRPERDWLTDENGVLALQLAPLDKNGP